jgi:hypothetical protein
MPTHLKATQSATPFFKECKLKTNLSHRVWHIWITLATTWFIFTKQIIFPISKSNTLVLANQEIYQE